MRRHVTLMLFRYPARKKMKRPFSDILGVCAAAAVALAVSVNELVVVAEAGLKDAVTPLGKPDAEKLTLPLKPFWGATVIVLDPFDP